MSITKLSSAEAKLALDTLRDHLAPSRLKGLNDLIALVDAEGRINLHAALEKLYPGKPRDAALNAFGVFRSDVLKGANEAGIQFQVGIDRQTQSAPSERQCWLEGEDFVLPELERQQEKLLATNPEYQAENFQPPSAKPTGPQYPIFISSSDRVSEAASSSEKALIKEFLELLRMQLDAMNRSDLANGIWHFREHQDNGMHIHMQHAIKSCRVGLLLFSDAYMRSRYVKTEEIPHFIPARFRARESDARDSIAIMLSGCGVNDDPGDVNRRLSTDHGDFGFQILRWEDRQNFSQCTLENKRRFAALVAEKLIAKFSSPDGPKTGERMRDVDSIEHFEWALRDTRKEHYNEREYERNLACKARLGRAAHAEQQIAESDEPDGFDIIQHLMDWATAKDGPNLHALLGELGSGKTFTCRMFARHLLEKRRSSPAGPLPVYIDLREIFLADSSGATVPTLDDILKGWLSNWQHADNKLDIERLKQLMRENRLLVIFDGFDEISVRLPRNSDQQFLRELWRMATFGGKVLISCRSHYFPTLQDQNALLLDEARGTVAARRRETRDAQLECTGSVLLPFTEEQIRSYLVRSLGEEEAQRALSVISATHNLRDLASRAYLLRLIRDHVDELAAQREAGQTINAASLYRLFIDDWLQRDHGKEVIDPPDKLELMERLAIKLWQSPQRSWSYTALRKWVLDEFAGNRGWMFRYQTQADLVAKDLHTATFLVREGDDSFRFAHSSLHEYFVAARLLSALKAGELAVWDVADLSRETLIFFGEQLELLSRTEQTTVLNALNQIHARPPSPQAALLALDYLQLAQNPARGLPHRLPTELDLSHADLFQRRFAPLSTQLWRLHRLILNGALANQTSFEHLHVEQLEATDARLAGSRWQQCDIRSADFTRADLAGAQFRHCRIADAILSDARLRDSCFRHTELQCQAISSAVARDSVWALHSKLPLAARTSPAKTHLVVEAGHSNGVNACVFSPDGRRLLSASRDDSLRLWDVEFGQCVGVFEGHFGSVSGCAFSPDGRHLLSASTDRSLRLWDAKTGECLRVFKGHSGAVHACVFSPDGGLVLSASDDRSLRLWDAESGNCLRVFEGHSGPVSACVFSPDGRSLLSASADASLCLWDANTGECLRVFEGHSGPVNACAVSPDGRLLLSASIDRSLRLWEVESGECLRVFEAHGEWGNSCAFSLDGRHFLSVSSSSGLRLWDAESGQCLRVFEGYEGGACAFSPDGHRLLSATSDASLCQWDVESGQRLGIFEGQFNGVSALAFSPDGRRLLSADFDGRLCLWDVESGQCLGLFEDDSGEVNSCAVSPDGRQWISACWGGNLHLRNLESGECLRVFSGHSDGVSTCVFSVDGARLLSAGWDSTLRLWDVESGECLRLFEGHSTSVEACAFSIDGRRIFSVSNGQLRFWDAESGECVRVVDGLPKETLACAFSFDGCRLLLASEDGELCLWDVESGECLRVLEEYSDGVVSCAFSPDGRRVLSAGFDNRLCLWDVESGECLLVLEGYYGLACAFNPDGSRFAVGSNDRSMRLWDAESGQQLWSVLQLKSGGLVWLDAHGEIARANDAAWPYLGYFANEADGTPIWVPVEVCDIPTAN